MPGFLERLGRAVSREVVDLYELGPRFMSHHIQRTLRRPEARLQVPGAGSIVTRMGNSDVAVLRQIFVGREYDLEGIPAFDRIRERERDILARGKRPIIVDAGANIGTATRWFQLQFPSSSIVAIEPEPDNVRILRRNAGSAVVIEAAIGSEGGSVELSDYKDSWAVATTRSDAGIPIVTVDQACAQIDNGELFIAKFDIEGFESDLFAANLDWLDRAYVVILEPHDWRFPGKGTSRSFQQAMGARPFELYIKGENLIYVRL